MTDTRLRLKVAIERLSDLEEQHAAAQHRSNAGDAKAEVERRQLIGEIGKAQKLISRLN